MAFIQKITETITTGSSSVTAYIPSSGTVTGILSSIIYSTTATPYSTTVDFAITVEGTGEGVWTEANVVTGKTVAPRQPTHDLAGVANLYAATFPVEDEICLENDRIKVVLAQGGVSKTGTFIAIFK